MSALRLVYPNDVISMHERHERSATGSDNAALAAVSPPDTCFSRIQNYS